MSDKVQAIEQLQQQRFESTVSITMHCYDATEKLSHLNLTFAKKTVERFGQVMHGLTQGPGNVPPMPDWQLSLNHLTDYFRSLNEIAEQTRQNISSALQQVR